MNGKRQVHRPAPPPEAQLLYMSREAAGIKRPEAARQAGMSRVRWGHIENGSEVRDGNRRGVTAQAGVLARMAAVVGITPDQLVSVGRSDAAVILEEILRRRGLAPAVPLQRPPPALVEARDRPHYVNRTVDDYAAYLASRGDSDTHMSPEEIRGWCAALAARLHLDPTEQRSLSA